MTIRTEPMTVNVGPQHPSTHGVFRVRITFDGEDIVEVEPVLGYLHRGSEKLAEERNYVQVVTLTDRLDYTSSMINNQAYCLAVEQLLGIEPPTRGKYLRTLTAELQRIASHLLWLGTHALDIGAMTPLFYTFREREEILKIFENYCGARLTTHSFRIGGLQYDTYDGFEDQVRKFANDLERKIDEYERLLTLNRIWVGRTRGVGILTAEDAIALGVSGPVLRGSGVKWDIRKAQPYEAYAELDFEIPVGQQGDTYDRYIVRLEEMRQSRRIILQAVDRLPTGPIKGRVPRVLKPPIGEVYHSVEAPKGELGYFVVSDGSTHPYRVRIRPPSFVNLQAFDRMVRGRMVADVVAIIGTIDIVLGEVDR
jgi:NADH-quinone oxidoreductase subunit D